MNIERSQNDVRRNFFELSVLAHVLNFGPSTGYEIMHSVEPPLISGSVYPALHRLEADDVLFREQAEVEVKKGPTSFAYSLTIYGLYVAVKSLKHLQVNPNILDDAKHKIKDLY